MVLSHLWAIWLDDKTMYIHRRGCIVGGRDHNGAIITSIPHTHQLSYRSMWIAFAPWVKCFSVMLDKFNEFRSEYCNYLFPAIARKLRMLTSMSFQSMYSSIPRISYQLFYSLDKIFTNFGDFMKFPQL